MFTISVIQENGAGKDKKSYFKQCGVGFENRDGSVNFRLDLFPNVTFHLRQKQSDAAEPEQKNGR